ncbi:pathogenesis-related transcriptional activator PTI6-like [Quillaja saponaria]|uniref:Pathogenesis-related transcriptional activator PTI6-like n=1 Tax=Quillaja saponaria TaxID=32244 RepID=A0AAD7LU37_QUISA|nr:pathogenesis-related transcriptional activator PTI6-like [Quillaja saponaria]
MSVQTIVELSELIILHDHKSPSTISDSVSSGDEPVCKTRRKPQQQLVRIIITDADATDSSSDDEQEKPERRVKRQIREINLDTSSSDSSTSSSCASFSSCDKPGPAHRPKRSPSCNATHPVQKVQGRSSETMGTMGRRDSRPDPSSTTNCLSSFDSAATSPTSVLHYNDGESTPFDGFCYGGVDAFGFDIDIDVPLNLPDMTSSNQHLGDEEFGEFDVNDFLVDAMC